MVGTEGFRPDLIVLDASKNKVFIVEVMVPYDYSLKHLNSRFSFKLDKYNSQPIKNEVAKIFLGPAFDQANVQVLPVIVGARGAITTRTLGSLGTLSCKSIAFKLQCCALGSSLALWDWFRGARVRSSGGLGRGGRRQVGGGITSNTDGPAGRPPDAL